MNDLLLGLYGQINTYAETNDGGIIIAGNFTNYGGITGRNYLVKVTQDGVINNEFTTNASNGAKFNLPINKVKQRADGSILIAGNFTNYSGITNQDYLILLNADGTLNTTFSNNVKGPNKFNSQIISFDIQSDGKIVLIGTFSNYEGRLGRSRLIRLNSDGTTDNTFNSVLDSPCIKTGAALVTTTAGSPIITYSGSFAPVSIGAEITLTLSGGASIVASGTYITDFYRVSSVNYIRLSNNVSSTTTYSILQGTGNYKFTGTTTVGSPQVATNGYRFFNSMCKTIGGQPYIWFALEPEDDGSYGYEKYGGKTIFCTGFPNGIPISGVSGNYLYYYQGIETFDNVRYYKFEVGSNAITNSTLSNALVGAVSFQATNSSTYVLNISDPLNMYGFFLQQGKPIFPSNPTAAGPFGVGVSAKIVSFTYYNGPALNDGWLITVDKPITTAGTFTLDFGEFSIPYTTKVNELFKPSVGFLGAQQGMIQFQNYGSNGSIAVFSENATQPVNMVITSPVKFGSNTALSDISIDQIDNSIYLGYSNSSSNDNYYCQNYLFKNITKFSSSAIVNRNFSNNIQVFDPNAFLNMGTVNSIVVDPDSNIIVGGNFMNYGSATSLMKLAPNGTEINSFNNNIDINIGIDNDSDPISAQEEGGGVYSVYVQKNGYDATDYKILIGGAFRGQGYGYASGRDYFVRLNKDGSIDSQFCIQLVDGKFSGILNPYFDKFNVANPINSELTTGFYLFTDANEPPIGFFNKYDYVLNKI